MELLISNNYKKFWKVRWRWQPRAGTVPWTMNSVGFLLASYTPDWVLQKPVTGTCQWHKNNKRHKNCYQSETKQELLFSPLSGITRDLMKNQVFTPPVVIRPLLHLSVSGGHREVRQALLIAGEIPEEAWWEILSPNNIQ